MFYQGDKVINSAHTLLHHLEDSSEDLTELVYCLCTSQIMDSAHPKRYDLIDNDDSVAYLIHMLLASIVYDSFSFI